MTTRHPIVVTAAVFAMNWRTVFLVRPLHHVAVVLALFANGATAQTAHAPDSALAFDTALLAYERNHWDAAFATLVQLADRGHAEAARMALQMWRFGPKLYQTNFSANAEQANRWAQLRACGGDATGRACQVARRAP